MGLRIDSQTANSEVSYPGSSDEGSTGLSANLNYSPKAVTLLSATFDDEVRPERVCAVDYKALLSKSKNHFHCNFVKDSCSLRHIPSKISPEN